MTSVSPTRFGLRGRFSFELVLVTLVILTPVLIFLAVRTGDVGAQAAAPTFVNYESGPVRPLATTPSGDLLLVSNTPAAQLDVLKVQADGSLLPLYSVPVGLEPVAVAARTESEVWVVNHLSDSVSIVDLNSRQVVQTLLVGDEPRDIVFAGANNERAFITTAHRGQRRMDAALASVPGAGDPQLTTASVGRADAWVFDTGALGNDPGGVPLAIKSFFADTPRALTVSNDGATVFVASHFSGNQTTVIAEPLVCDGFRANTECNGDGITSPGGLPNGRMPGGVLGPDENHEGTNAVETGIIVKYDNDAQMWTDEAGRNWNNGVRFTLPDTDVFAVDAMSLSEVDSYAHVGTILYNMATNPVSDRVWVTNTDSQNHIRFEGHSESGHSSVQGRTAKSQISVLDPATGDVTVHHLNTHIDYDVRPAPAGTKDHTLSTPLDLVFSGDGATAYVTAYGSSKVGVIDTAALEAGSYDPVAASPGHIGVSGGGPSGLVLNDATNQMYVFTRFDVGVSVIDLATNTESDHILLDNPEPTSVREGRPIMYDATFGSSNGESSCASCHVFGDVDQLGWNLGNPDADTLTNPLDFELRNTVGGSNGTGRHNTLNALKGPMATQTLKGLANSGAMHWRADRSVGFFGTDKENEELSFKNFIVAFPELLGSELHETDPVLQDAMQKFTDFTLTMMLPPNPVRNLDRSFTPLQQEGQDLFMGTSRIDSGVRTCTQCHEMDASQGRFGTSLKMSFEGEIQHIKIPHIRNMYTKVGMFGMADNDEIRALGNDHMGDQIRGFGFNANGSMDTLNRFFGLNVFRTNQQQRDAIAASQLAADSDLAPVVGQQLTLAAGEAANSRLSLLESRSGTEFISLEMGGVSTDCSLIAHTVIGPHMRGFLFNPTTNLYEPDSIEDPAKTRTDLLADAAAEGNSITFTCASPGAGRRLALDRNQDGVLDGDALPDSLPGDVNCDGEATLADALIVTQHVVGLRSVVVGCPLVGPDTELNLEGADVNLDATVGMIDAVAIAQCVASIPNPYCESMETP